MEERIEVNPEIMVGKPVIKGTRIPVYLIVRLVAQGMTPKEIMEDYPHLKAEDIKAALEYAAELASGEQVFPIVKAKK